MLPAQAASLGLPLTPSPLGFPLTGMDTLNDARVALQDNSEGYWLGAFCFRRPLHFDSEGKPVIEKGKTLPKLGPPLPNGSSSSPCSKAMKLPRSTFTSHTVCRLTRCNLERASPADGCLCTVTVHFNEHDARQHMIRFRELTTGGQPDPSTLGVDAGFSVHDAIRNKQSWIEEASHAAVEPQKGGKGGKQGQNKAANSSSESKEEVSSSNPFADWKNWEASAVTDVIPEQARKNRVQLPCLRNISVAAWSPPPAHLRAQGHFFYLHVVTLENESFYVTACSEGFYINGSTSGQFIPSRRPDPPALPLQPSTTFSPPPRRSSWSTLPRSSATL